MFTVLSNTRNSNLYLIAALAVIGAVLVIFATVPTISTSHPALIPNTGISAAESDYFQRHQELSLPIMITAVETEDFALRHSGWSSNVSAVGIPVTGVIDLSDFYTRQQAQKLPGIRAEGADYFMRHTDLSAPVATVIDMNGDFSLRHVELRPVKPSTTLSDYFLRH